VDWIERVFHVSPDGGSGSLELLIAVALAAAVAAILSAKAHLGRERARHRRS
jgi:hypothetical protein